MYTGHFGIALIGKGVERGVSLWIFIAAAFAPDLLISLSQLLLGMQKQVIEPIVSSLAGGLGLALLVAFIYLVFFRYRRGSILMGGITFSHVLADFITGRSHLWPGGPETGLHLYRFEYADFTLEASLVIAGWLLYHRTLPAESQRTWPAWVILIMLLGLQLYFEIRPLF